MRSPSKPSPIMSKFLTAKMPKKSQSSVEFLTLSGLAFFVVIIFVALAADEIREFKDRKDFFLVKDLALKLQKEAAVASSVEDGFERVFTLPDKLQSSVDYFITTSNNTITVNSSKAVFSVRIAPIVGNFSKGSNKLEKIDGNVYINK
jgi:hypothetical protein